MSTTVDILVDEELVGTLPCSENPDPGTRSAENLVSCLDNFDDLLAAYKPDGVEYTQRVERLITSVCAAYEDPSLRLSFGTAYAIRQLRSISP